MVRAPLTPEERDRGERLGRLLRAARGGRSMAQVAAAAGISVETLRKIETGRIPAPAFFTVAAVGQALGLSLDQLAHATSTVGLRVAPGVSGSGSSPGTVPPGPVPA